MGRIPMLRGLLTFAAILLLTGCKPPWEANRIAWMRGPVQEVVFSPAGDRMLATFGRNGGPSRYVLYDLVGDREVAELGRPVATAAFSRDGAQLALLYEDGGLEERDARSGRVIRTLKPSPPTPNAPQKLAPGGARILVRTREQPLFRRSDDPVDVARAQLRDTASGRTVAEIHGSGQIGIFSPDGSRLATLALGGIQIWDTAGGRQIGVVPIMGQLGQVSFSPDSRRLVVKAEVWDADTGRLAAVLQGRPRLETPGPPVIGNDAYDPASRFISDGTNLWDLGSGRGRRLQPYAAEQTLFTRDGRRLLVARRGQILIFDVASGRQVGALGKRREPPVFWRYVYGMALSPDGRQVFVDMANRKGIRSVLVWTLPA